MSAAANQARGGVRSRAQIPISTSEARRPCVCARVFGTLTNAVKAAFCATNTTPYRLGKLVATTQRSDAIPRRRMQGAAGTR